MASANRVRIVWGLAAAAVIVLAGCGSSEEKPNAGSTGVAPAADAAPAPAAVPAAEAAAAAQPESAVAAELGEVWPTEEEAKATIFKIEYEIYASQTNKDVWHVKDMKHEVHSVKFAKHTTQKQMRYGQSAITVYPAKILYTQIVEYTDKEATREEQGADGVWFFYQDSFGEWTGKYGSE